MVGLIFWGIISIGIIALFFVLAYHSARIQDGNVSATPEWVLEVGAAIVAGAIGISFILVKYGLDFSEAPSWVVFLTVAAVVAGGLALFCIAAGAQETRVCEFRRTLADKRAEVAARRARMNERFIESLMKEDLSDVEIEEFESVARPLDDTKLRTIFGNLSSAELSRL